MGDRGKERFGVRSRKRLGGRHGGAGTPSKSLGWLAHARAKAGRGGDADGPRVLGRGDGSRHPPRPTLLDAGATTVRPAGVVAGAEVAMPPGSPVASPAKPG